jgi:cytochrome P450
MTDTLPDVNPNSEDFYQSPFFSYAMQAADAPLHEISKGNAVFLAYSFANRDGATCADLDPFDSRRKNVKEHHAFGHGIHVCVGVGLARMGLASASCALRNSVTALEIADLEVLRGGPSYKLRGLTGLPIRLNHTSTSLLSQN